MCHLEKKTIPIEDISLILQRKLENDTQDISPQQFAIFNIPAYQQTESLRLHIQGLVLQAFFERGITIEALNSELINRVIELTRKDYPIYYAVKRNSDQAFWAEFGLVPTEEQLAAILHLVRLGFPIETAVHDGVIHVRNEIIDSFKFEFGHPPSVSELDDARARPKSNQVEFSRLLSGIGRSNQLAALHSATEGRRQPRTDSLASAGLFRAVSSGGSPSFAPSLPSSVRGQMSWLRGNDETTPKAQAAIDDFIQASAQARNDSQMLRAVEILNTSLRFLASSNGEMPFDLTLTLELVNQRIASRGYLVHRRPRLVYGESAVFLYKIRDLSRDHLETVEMPVYFVERLSPAPADLPNELELTWISSHGYVVVNLNEVGRLEQFMASHIPVEENDPQVLTQERSQRLNQLGELRLRLIDKAMSPLASDEKLMVPASLSAFIYSEIANRQARIGRLAAPPKPLDIELGILKAMKDGDPFYALAYALLGPDWNVLWELFGNGGASEDIFATWIATIGQMSENELRGRAQFVYARLEKQWEAENAQDLNHETRNQWHENAILMGLWTIAGIWLLPTHPIELAGLTVGIGMIFSLLHFPSSLSWKGLFRPGKVTYGDGHTEDYSFRKHFLPLTFAAIVFSIPYIIGSMAITSSFGELFRLGILAVVAIGGIFASDWIHHRVWNPYIGRLWWTRWLPKGTMDSLEGRTPTGEYNPRNTVAELPAFYSKAQLSDSLSQDAPAYHIFKSPFGIPIYIAQAALNEGRSQFFAIAHRYPTDDEEYAVILKEDAKRTQSLADLFIDAGQMALARDVYKLMLKSPMAMTDGEERLVRQIATRKQIDLRQAAIAMASDVMMTALQSQEPVDRVREHYAFDQERQSLQSKQSAYVPSPVGLEESLKKKPSKRPAPWYQPSLGAQLEFNRIFQEQFGRDPTAHEAVATLDLSGTFTQRAETMVKKLRQQAAQAIQLALAEKLNIWRTPTEQEIRQVLTPFDGDYSIETNTRDLIESIQLARATATPTLLTHAGQTHDFTYNGPLRIQLSQSSEFARAKDLAFVNYSDGIRLFPALKTAFTDALSYYIVDIAAGTLMVVSAHGVTVGSVAQESRAFKLPTVSVSPQHFTLRQHPTERGHFLMTNLSERSTTLQPLDERGGLQTQQVDVSFADSIPVHLEASGDYLLIRDPDMNRFRVRKVAVGESMIIGRDMFERGEGVSREHLRVSHRADGWWIQDISRNGTRRLDGTHALLSKEPERFGHVDSATPEFKTEVGAYQRAETQTIGVGSAQVMNEFYTNHLAGIAETGAPMALGLVWQGLSHASPVAYAMLTTGYFLAVHVPQLFFDNDLKSKFPSLKDRIRFVFNKEVLGLTILTFGVSLVLPAAGTWIQTITIFLMTMTHTLMNRLGSRARLLALLPNVASEATRPAPAHATELDDPALPLRPSSDLTSKREELVEPNGIFKAAINLSA